MLIVYTQAGTEFTGAIGLPSLGGHAAIAVLGGERDVYISWVHTPGAGGINFEVNHFAKAGWSTPVYRVQIPTKEDGVRSDMSSKAALDWWDKDFYLEAQAFNKKWNKAPNPQDYRAALTGEYNCAEVVRKILLGAGGSSYNPSWSDASTPDTVARLASFIHRRVGASIAGAHQGWPAETAPVGFFAQDTLAGRNVHPWPKKPHALAPA